MTDNTDEADVVIQQVFQTVSQSINLLATLRGQDCQEHCLLNHVDLFIFIYLVFLAQVVFLTGTKRQIFHGMKTVAYSFLIPLLFFFLFLSAILATGYREAPVIGFQNAPKCFYSQWGAGECVCDVT